MGSSHSLSPAPANQGARYTTRAQPQGWPARHWCRLLAVFACIAVVSLGAQPVEWRFNEPPSLSPSEGSGTLLVHGLKTDFAAGSRWDTTTPPNQSLSLGGFPAQSSPENGIPGVELVLPIAGPPPDSVAFDWYATPAASRHLAVEVAWDDSPPYPASRFALERASTFVPFECPLPPHPAGSVPSTLLIRLSPAPGESGDFEPVAAERYSQSGKWRFDRLRIGHGPLLCTSAPPVIVSLAPARTNIVEGGGLHLTARIDSDLPPLLVWLRNSIPIPGATTPTLTLRGPDELQTGLYSLTAANCAGTVTSRITQVTVIPPFQDGEGRIGGHPIIVATNHILGTAANPGDLPSHRFPEASLRPGQSLRVVLHVRATNGAPITARSTSSLDPDPTHPRLALVASSTKDDTTDAEFEWTWRAADADQGNTHKLLLTFHAGPDFASLSRSLYIPTPTEQAIRLTEILANPSTSPSSPLHNPLRRPTVPDSNAGAFDEYLEWTNDSAAAASLDGWSLSDGTRVRHRFPGGASLGPGETMLVYGGPLEGFPIGVSGISFPASLGDGLGLNNGGDRIELRNASSNLVFRTAYTTPPSHASLLSDGLGGWQPHPEDHGTTLSPGHVTGWSPPPPASRFRAILVRPDPRTWRIDLEPAFSTPVSLWESLSPEGPFRRLGNLPQSRLIPDSEREEPTRFFRLTSP